MTETGISEHIWLIAPSYYHEVLLPRMLAIQSGKVVYDEEVERAKAKMVLVAVEPEPMTGFALDLSAAASGSTPSKGGYVAVIPLQGVMTKKVNWWYNSLGTEDIEHYIDLANADPKVTAIVLDANTPGGNVAGTAELGRAVANSAKPVVMYVNNMAASAGYWVGSQAREIVMADDHVADVGSIGTLLVHQDLSKMLEDYGVKITFVTADKSVDKVLGNWTEPLSDKALTMFKGELNRLNDQFIKTVKTGRKERLKTEGEDIYTGKMYHGARAISLGMADRVGSLKDAIYRADLLARKDKEQQSKQATHLTFDL